MAVTVPVLGACTRESAAPVEVMLPSARPAACGKLADRLPDRLGTLERRRTTPRDDRVAAWGDPPVVLRCAAPFATAYERGKPLVNVNGVAWFQVVEAQRVVWSTPTRFVNVEVVVPTAYDGHSTMLAPLSAAIRDAG